MTVEDEQFGSRKPESFSESKFLWTPTLPFDPKGIDELLSTESKLVSSPAFGSGYEWRPVSGLNTNFRVYPNVAVALLAYSNPEGEFQNRRINISSVASAPDEQSVSVISKRGDFLTVTNIDRNGNVIEINRFGRESSLEIDTEVVAARFQIGQPEASASNTLIQVANSFTVDDARNILESFRADPEVRFDATPLVKTFVDISDGEIFDVLKSLINETLEQIDVKQLSRAENVALEFTKLRYLQGLTVSRISDKMGFTREHLTRMGHRPGLELFLKHAKQNIWKKESEKP